MAEDLEQSRRPPHVERIALVLKGGGALGAYQAGGYQALQKAGYDPDWVAGISIGAINAAIIAGNSPEQRVERLRTFWQLVSSDSVGIPALYGDAFRKGFNSLSAGSAAWLGVPGFFRPRFGLPWMAAEGSDGAISLYDTSPLRASLLELVDFDRIANGPMRLSVTAVDVESGNSVVFDSAKTRIGIEHVMASAALPPAFPPVEIAGRLYWDGGILSNTPINIVLDDVPRRSTLAFQIDLFNQQGQRPGNLDDVVERQKDIAYSSRTRFNTDRFSDVHAMRRAIGDFLATVPEENPDAPQLENLWQYACNSSMTIVQLIYRHRAIELHSKNYEFSRLSMEEHWNSGILDVGAALRREAEWLDPANRDEAVRTIDATRP